MGAPSQTQVQTWTDQIAAMMLKDLAGYQSEYGGVELPVNGGGKAANSLFDMVDASNDPDVEAALNDASDGVDKHSLPERFGDAVMPVLLRTAYRNWVSRLSTLVQSTGGGSYTSLKAYLAAKAATVHPLWGELARSVVGDDFSISGDVTTIFAPSYAVRAADRFYSGADGTLTDDTTDAQDAGTADIALFAAANDAIYIGSRYRFSAAAVALSTVSSANITATFEYWNGNAW